MAAETAVAGAAAVYGAYSARQSHLDTKKAAQSEELARKNASLEARKLKEAEDKKMRGQVAARARRSLAAEKPQDTVTGSLGTSAGGKQSLSGLLGL